MKKVIIILLTLALVSAALPALAGNNVVIFGDNINSGNGKQNVVILDGNINTNGGTTTITQTTVRGTSMTMINTNENYDIIMTNTFDETWNATITQVVFHNPDKNVPLYSPLYINEYVIISDDLDLKWYIDNMSIRVGRETIPSTNPNDKSVYTLYTPQDIDDEYIIIERDNANEELILTWYVTDHGENI